MHHHAWPRGGEQSGRHLGLPLRGKVSTMAICLDSNVMYDWRTFAEADRVALAVLARELDQPVVVPTLVAEELEASLWYTAGRVEQAWGAFGLRIPPIPAKRMSELRPPVNEAARLHRLATLDSKANLAIIVTIVTRLARDE